MSTNTEETPARAKAAAVVEKQNDREFASPPGLTSHDIEPFRSILVFLDMDDQPVSEGIPGRVIASRLFSAAMPILRYDTGDSAVFRKLTEPDGTPGYRIVKVYGRNDEILTLPDGRMLSLPMVYHIFNDRLEIQQFRLVQEARSFFRIYIAASEPDYASVRPTLQKKLDELFLGSARYDMIRVDMIPPDTTGKFSAIVPLKGRRKTPKGALSCQDELNDQEQ